MNDYVHSNSRVFLDLVEMFTSEKTKKEMFLSGHCNASNEIIETNKQTKQITTGKQRY